MDIRLRKEAKTSLQAYRDQSLLRRRFGDSAVKLYELIDSGKPAAELIKKLGMPEEKFVEIIEFMNNNAMVSVIQGGAGGISPSFDSDAAGEDSGESRAQEDGSRARKWGDSQEGKGDDGRAAASDESGAAGGPESQGENDADSGNEGKNGSEGKGNDDGEGGAGGEGKGGGEQDSAETPEEEAASGDGDKDEGESGSGEEDAGNGDEAGGAGDSDSGGEKFESTSRRKRSSDTLSPLEKIIHDKYGEIGVQVYNLIDGEKTAEEILRQTGVSEAKLVEILEFMDEQGVIKLEKPPEKESADDEGKGDVEEGKDEPAQEPRFKPITEEEPEETPFVPPKTPAKEEPKKEIKPVEPEFAEDIVLVDVPSINKLSLMQKALMFAELSTKFPKGARQLVDLSDGNRDFVDLSLATGLSFFDIDAILAYFGKKGFVSFRQLAREEIKKKYGEDGFSIYKRFGREGLLLYEMIGKEASLRDIILKSRFDPDRAIDILIFIHKVLGLDVPIDRNIIYRQLGLRK